MFPIGLCSFNMLIHIKLWIKSTQKFDIKLFIVGYHRRDDAGPEC